MVTMPVDNNFVVTSRFGDRAGGFHWGTDYGRAGGSGGYPVYAVKDGTVTRSGPASGFGRWVTIDHPASNGGGETVYGHIVPEVSVGNTVREGQRIARIDPNSSTNGGVAPHLHLEWHRFSWVGPGPNRLDPETMLVGATWPGEAPATAVSAGGGTLFGVDVSEHQDGMSLRRAKDEGIEFAILRLCDGTHVDRTFQSHLDDAESAGLLVSTYWYLRAPSEGTSIAQQVDVIDRQMNGRPDLGVWIDVESVGTGGQKLLTEQDVWAAKRELESRGYHVPGIYSGAWYWEYMPGGEPSMEGLGHLWVSNYGKVDRSGAAKAIYDASGGGNHAGWSYPLGDRKPDILQFGSRGIVAGHSPVDVNAYRGTREQLASIFHPKNTAETTPKPTFLESLMSQNVKSFINPAKSFPAGTALSLIDASNWRQEVLNEALLQALGIDTERVLAAAIEADTSGGDRTQAIRQALNLKEK